MLQGTVSNFSWVIPAYAQKLPRMVYALAHGANGNVVSSYKIAPAGASLSQATSSAPVANGAVSVTVHPSRRFAYVTNASSFGAPGAAPGIAPNSVSVYQLDATTGAISGPTDTKPANGNPISTVVHPTGRFVYVVNEERFGATVGNVSVYSIDSTTGALTAQGTAADIGGSPATAIAFHPSGEFAYVTYMPPDPTNAQNFDTVKTFAVDHTTGMLTGPIGTAPTGDNPWAMVVTPGGHFAYVASLSTQGNVSQLSTYAVNQTTGVLALTGSRSPASSPSAPTVEAVVEVEEAAVAVARHPRPRPQRRTCSPSTSTPPGAATS